MSENGINVIPAQAGNGVQITLSDQAIQFLPILYTMTEAPTPSDNCDLGYKIGDQWVDTSSNKIYVLISCVGGTAVWADFSSNPNKGFYADETALNAAYPTALDGDYAFLASTSTIWTWDSDTEAWVDSESGSAVTSVDGKVGDVDGRYGGTYFVRSNGSDGNSGLSYIQAKATIAASITAATAGNAVVLHGGSTFTESVTAKNGVAVVAPAVTLVGNISVGAGVNCRMEFGKITGNVTVAGTGTLYLRAYEIDGTITINAGATVYADILRHTGTLTVTGSADGRFGKVYYAAEVNGI